MTSAPRSYPELRFSWKRTGTEELQLQRGKKQKEGL